MSGIDEGDKMSNVLGKPWKNEGYFDTFEDANYLRQQLKGSDRTNVMQFKVKRCGENGSKYVVKSRVDENALAELQQIEENLLTPKNKKSKK